MNKSRKTAVVTGASSGIGVFFARELGRRGYDVMIVARRHDRLRELADEIRTVYGVETLPLELDLCQESSCQALLDATEGQGRPVDVLINNAGMACHGAFLDLPWERVEAEMCLNVRAVTQLTYIFGRRMRERGQGYILNVSSVVSYLPVPSYATYAAGKAFVRSLSLALADELRGSGVKVSALCPGGVRTEFFEAAGHLEISTFVRATLAKPDDVARIGLDALFKGRSAVVPGWRNQLSVFFLRLLPLRAQIALARLIGR